MRKDHDLIAWLLFATLALVLGVMALANGQVFGLALMLLGVGLGAAGVLRWRRTTS